MAYRKTTCFKVIIGLQYKNRHLGLNMLARSRQSWSRKPGCWRRVSGSCADTPQAAVGLWPLTSMIWPKPHRTQNVPIRTTLTKATSPLSARSFLQLMSIHSQGKKVRAEQMRTFPSTLSQLLLGRGLQWCLQSLRVFCSIDLWICSPFIPSENKRTN